MAKLRKRDDDIHRTPDVAHIQNPDVAHETSDVNVYAILQFVVGLVILAALVHVLMWAMFRLLEERQARLERANPPSPMAITSQEQVPPEPRLQDAPGWSVQVDPQEANKLRGEGYRVDQNGRVNLQFEEPQAERKILMRLWDEQLKNGQRDPTTGAVESIPINQAMQQVAGQGLPARPQPPGGDDQISSGQQIPTYQSSGRMMERRKQ